MTNYRWINYEVMSNTKRYYETNSELADAVRHSIAGQYMVANEEYIDMPVPEQVTTQYKVSEKRSFEAARTYTDKKVAVLNYANNHSIGGAPFSAGTYEVTLFQDGPNADKAATDYRVLQHTVTLPSSGAQPVTLHLASGGGFACKLIKKN